jgi:hypothetical protein
MVNMDNENKRLFVKEAYASLISNFIVKMRRNYLSIFSFCNFFIIFGLLARYAWIIWPFIMNSDAAFIILWPKIVLERGLLSNGLIGTTDNPITSIQFVPAIFAHFIGFNWSHASWFASVFTVLLSTFLFGLLLKSLKFSFSSIFISCLFLISVNHSD